MKNTSKNALSLSHLSMQESPETNTHTLSEIFGAPIGREESIAQIAASPETKAAFQSLSFGAKEEMIAFFQNQKIPPITSDPFFKKLFNPTEHPDRLRDFLSCILQKEISSLTPLPLEGIKLAEESSFVVLDLVVQTADGETIDVEMQKIGYDFPGQRSDCYAADFIMRQYAKEKAERGKQFNYRDLCPVYVIVLMEQSSSVFRKSENREAAFFSVQHNNIAAVKCHRNRICKTALKAAMTAENREQISLAAVKKHLCVCSVQCGKYRFFANRNRFKRGITAFTVIFIRLIIAEKELFAVGSV